MYPEIIISNKKIHIFDGILIVLLGALKVVNACKATYQYNTDYQTMFPSTALDICMDDILNASSLSYYLTCDKNENLKFREFQYSNCKGWSSEYYVKNDPFVDDVECEGRKCDYALLKLSYLATNSCRPNNINFAVVPYVVNECTKINDYPVKSNRRSNIGAYMLVTCNESMVMHHIHFNNDCSDTATSKYIDFIDGNCYNDGFNKYHLRIMNCTPPNDYILDELQFASNVFNDICYGVEIIIYLWVVIKIFVNLYQFESISIGKKSICCKITFSDKHNWLIVPSDANKVYALLTPTLYMFCGICYLIGNVGSYLNSNLKYLIIFTSPLEGLSVLFYILFMTSTLEYYTNADGLIKQMINTKFMMVVKVVSVLNWLLLVCKTTAGYYSIFDYDILTHAYSVVIVCIELSLLFLYYRGMNNLCHYWYSKRWEEYDKHGENERIHEILIDVSRVSVAVISYVFSLLLWRILIIPVDIILSGDRDYQTQMILYGYVILGAVISSILYIPYATAIYFTYPFAHTHYEKICGKCQKKMYGYLKMRHQNQVKNGAFDGTQYQSSYTGNTCSCFCIRHKNQNNIRINLTENNDHIELTGKI